jgi:hypothetical protein
MPFYPLFAKGKERVVEHSEGRVSQPRAKGKIVFHIVDAGVVRNLVLKRRTLNGIFKSNTLLPKFLRSCLNVISFIAVG